MKTFNEHATARLASLRRQHQQLTAQIEALQTYLLTARPKPPVSKPASTEPQKPKHRAKPTKRPAKTPIS